MKENVKKTEKKSEVVRAIEANLRKQKCCLPGEVLPFSQPIVVCISFTPRGDRRTQYFLKKNLNAPRPSEHPPVRGKKCQNV